MPNIAEELQEATKILQNSGIAEPRREASSVLSFALKKDKTFLIAHPEYELTEKEEEIFQDFLNRRAAHEPFQYIVGKQEFYGLDFWVTPDVLIPRPETELIVEKAIEILKAKENPQFCEVGIGSGCISVAILHEVRTASAIGLDVSEKALRIAEKNAKWLGVLERLNLKVSDVFAEFNDEKFDLIVSNPPYVPSEDFSTLQAEVRDFEPQVALTDGKDGLSIIEKLIIESPEFLKSNGFLLMEIGFNQSNKVRRMFAPEIWREVDFFPDLQGIPRMIK
ncbi:MAG TPA: peptide chain release factor N(5)-glutamine methyltransferase, partial [Pyrinomonadaceae bacterium]|nr:peptide chain release factor N(5)-glutamine methyltransferase [Pyrinomonadaceae bacterium]